MTNRDSDAAGRTIIIVGAGYSGAFTAVNLLRDPAFKGGRVILVDHSPPFGRGLAYRIWDDNMLLNVPAGNMSALANDPNHFVEYCQRIDPAFNASTFISRRIYGDYLEQTLAEAEKNSSAILQKVQGEVIAVQGQSAAQSFLVQLADGQQWGADQVVLALGHFLPRPPQSAANLAVTQAYFNNPWDYAALNHIAPDCPVAILGAGHTAIDTLFRLTNSGNTRKVFLLSRRGLLPHSHRLAHKPNIQTAFPPYLTNIPNTIRAYVRAIRQEIEQRTRVGGDWRDVINALRAHTPTIWGKLPDTERRKFLARIAPFWDIHRHRLAPSAYLRLAQMRQSGRVETIAGQILGYEVCGDNVTIRIKQKKDHAIREVVVGAVVNCTGPTYDLSTLANPLVKQLRQDGLLTQDALKIGLKVDEQYQVIDQNGRAVPNLFYVGPMLKAKYWEAIAVPELRIHTFKLAKQLLAG
jgi:uncharacterized NAD(P)/FAD-binding protein YdhS